MLCSINLHYLMLSRGNFHSEKRPSNTVLPFIAMGVRTGNYASPCICRYRQRSSCSERRNSRPMECRSAHDDKDGVDYRISHTPLALVYHCEIITTQSRLKPEVAPSHNDVIRQLNSILTAHLNLAERANSDKSINPILHTECVHDEIGLRNEKAYTRVVRLYACRSLGGRHRRRRNTRIGLASFVTAAKLNSWSTFSISFEIKWKRLRSDGHKTPSRTEAPFVKNTTSVWNYATASILLFPV